MERAYEEHDFWMQWLAVDAAFDFLHDDPRFSELLKKVVFKRSNDVSRSDPKAVPVVLSSATVAA